MTHIFTRARRAAAVAGVLGLAAIAACSTDNLLQVVDPDFIPPDNLDNPAGADALRLGAIQRWRLATGADNTNGQESTWLFGGLLADEWGTASTFVQNDEVDKRAIGADNSTVLFAFRKLHRVRTAVNQALPKMGEFLPNQTTQIAELLFARAFAEMQLALDFCSGIPFSDAADFDSPIDWGDPISTDSAFRRAINTADSGLAIVSATATDTQTANVRNGLRIIKARAQLGLNDLAGAAATVSAVPTSHIYNHTFSASVGSNAIWGQPFSGSRYLVGNNLEGNDRSIQVFNAIPFFDLKDPRVPSFYTISSAGDTARSQDGQTLSRRLGTSSANPVYAQFTSVSVTRGIDARLIEAEAQLAAGNPAWLTTLNALRAAQHTIGTTTTPVMAPLVDPGTPDARLDLFFREKAMWTFTRGHRLGDLRRLVRYYGRSADNVYPRGVHYRGGSYGTDVNLPVPQEELNNPKYTGGCSTSTP